jgi:hypothetical protein
MIGDSMNNILDKSFFKLFWNKMPRYILLGVVILLVIASLISERQQNITIERVYPLLIAGTVWLFIVTLRELKPSIDQTMDSNQF